MPVARKALALTPCLMALVLALAGCAASGTQTAHRDARPAAPRGATESEEPTAAEAAMAMTMRSAPTAHDCDCNGIADSLDVLAGRTIDVNRNGMDDDCDDDPAVRRRAWSEDWRQAAAVHDTAALLVRHECGKEVWIRYTVPPGGAAVRLVARAPSGKAVRTMRDGPVPSGAYEFIWNQTDDHGAAVADSTTYSITLEFGRHVYTRPVFWWHAR